MRHGVVEGEPGVFPAPVAKIMRTIGGIFSRKKPTPDATSSSPPDDKSFSDLDPKPPTDRKPEP